MSKFTEIYFLICLIFPFYFRFVRKQTVSIRSYRELLIEFVLHSSDQLKQHCMCATRRTSNAWFPMGRVKRIWYLSPMRAAKVQASLRIRAVSPEPPLLAHTSSESRGTFRQKARPLAPVNGWACAVKICHDGMLEVTNSLDATLYSWMSKRMVAIHYLMSMGL